MREIPSAYLGILLTYLVVTVMLCIIVSDINVAHASEFHADAMCEIEDSNFSPEVIETLKENADTAKYELNVNCMQDTNGVVVMAVVELKYNYAIPLLNVLSEHKKVGIAR